MGLFVAAGVAWGIALGEQIAAEVIIDRACLRPYARDGLDFEDESTARKCIGGSLPALGLRVHAGLNLLAASGMVIGGAALRGRRDAHDLAAKQAPINPRVGREIAGGALLGVGASLALISPAASLGALAGCETYRCVSGLRAAAVGLRTGGVTLAIAGAGILVHALVRRSRHSELLRTHKVAWSPTLGRDFAGVSIHGSF